MTALDTIRDALPTLADEGKMGLSWLLQGILDGDAGTGGVVGGGESLPEYTAGVETGRRHDEGLSLWKVQIPGQPTFYVEALDYDGAVTKAAGISPDAVAARYARA